MENGWLLSLITVDVKTIDWIQVPSSTHLMALRVLLADESTTIKKVFQLSLQDFAVEVCAVSVGLDVTQVAKQFKPDIIFCDVLLQKKNGYDVCAEIKSDGQLRTIPVILMWSGFMELDEDKLQAARAEAQLEKPFDVQDLRKLIHQFVPKTKNHRLGEFLTFPKMPDMVESHSPPELNTAASPSLSATPPSPTASQAKWTMENFDPIPSVNLGQKMEDFQEVPLPPPPKTQNKKNLETPHEEEEDDLEVTQWSAKSLNQFQVPDFKDEEEDELGVILPENEDSLHNPPPPVAASPTLSSSPLLNATSATTPQSPLYSDAVALEKIIREQTQTIIENIAWKVIPDLATQIIERELQRLLADKSVE